MRSEKVEQRGAHISRARLSLVEALALGLGMVVVLAGAAGATRYVRDELKTTQTRMLLARLEEGMRVYYRATGVWPGAATARGRGREGERGEEGVVAALWTVAGAREILERTAREMPGMIQENSVRDAWGNRLHCLTAASADEKERLAVVAHGGGPILVSAGSDGEGGEEIRSDES